MTPPRKDSLYLVLALDAFLAEHRGCWHTHGMGLQSGDDAQTVWLDCLRRGVHIAAMKSAT